MFHSSLLGLSVPHPPEPGQLTPKGLARDLRCFRNCTTHSGSSDTCARKPFRFAGVCFSPSQHKRRTHSPLCGGRRGASRVGWGESFRIQPPTSKGQAITVHPDFTVILDSLFSAKNQTSRNRT